MKQGLCSPTSIPQAHNHLYSARSTFNNSICSRAEPMNALKNSNMIGRRKMEYKDIIYTNEEGIVTITLNRPEAMNAFSPEMSESITRAVQDSAQDDSVRVIIIT